MIGTLAFLAAVLQGDPAAEEALDKFKTAFKSPDAKVRADAVAALARTPHETVVARLGSLLRTDEAPLRVAAARGLGASTGELKKPAVKQLLAGLSSSVNQGEPEARAAMLAALGLLREEEGMEAVHKAFDDKDGRVAGAAVGAAGAIRSKESVTPLIDLLAYLQKVTKPPPPPKPAIAGGYGKSIPQSSPVESKEEKDRRARAGELLPKVRGALQAITRQTALATAEEWRGWWTKNKSGFAPEK